MQKVFCTSTATRQIRKRSRDAGARPWALGPGARLAGPLLVGHAPDLADPPGRKMRRNGQHRAKSRQAAARAARRGRGGAARVHGLLHPGGRDAPARPRGQRGRARVGEIGTGAGVGAAWIVSALDPAVPFLTCEPDPRLAAAAAELFARGPERPRAARDWSDVARLRRRRSTCSSYDGGAGPRSTAAGRRACSPRADTAVLDDLTPGRPERDPVRELWLGHPDLAAVEILTTPSTAAIVAVRVR